MLDPIRDEARFKQIETGLRAAAPP
jgi:hypothetical protein